MSFLFTFNSYKKCQKNNFSYTKFDIIYIYINFGIKVYLINT